MRNLIWYGVYEVFPEKEEIPQGEFRREKDAMEHKAMLEGKYPDRQYTLLMCTQMDIWEWEEMRKS